MNTTAEANLYDLAYANLDKAFDIIRTGEIISDKAEPEYGEITIDCRAIREALTHLEILSSQIDQLSADARVALKNLTRRHLEEIGEGNFYRQCTSPASAGCGYTAADVFNQLIDLGLIDGLRYDDATSKDMLNKLIETTNRFPYVVSEAPLDQVMADPTETFVEIDLPYAVTADGNAHVSLNTVLYGGGNSEAELDNDGNVIAYWLYFNTRPGDPVTSVHVTLTPSGEVQIDKVAPK